MRVEMYSSLNEAVKDLFGSSRKITGQGYVTGGDINDAYEIVLDDGLHLFMKRNVRSALANFQAEAAGLDAIRATGAIRVPEILGIGTDGADSFLLLEFIEKKQRVKHFWEIFAEELAAMHCAPAAAQVGFGFPEDNWIGARKQINTPHDSWVDFFRDCRLEVQFRAADQYFSPQDRKRIDFLLSHLDRYLTEPVRPSLLHGDLWSGNMITGPDGKGWLIDPAVYYGHPEVDIAMTELFGGFSQEFYETYREAGAMEDGYLDRRDLYNLYQLLNHLNMFGRSYLDPVLRIVKRYGGG